MSKKSIPFKVAPMPKTDAGTSCTRGEARPSIVSAEAWVHQPQSTPKASDALSLADLHRRSLFVLYDDPNWFDLVYACAILPSVTWWLWLLKGYSRTSHH